jgi:hypothetical protein
VTEQEVLSFVGTSLRSVWALEVLLLLRRQRERAFSTIDIVRETRSSETAAADALTLLSAAALISEESGRFRYRPASPQLETLAAAFEALYAAKPATVIKTILAAPHDKLRTFSDAFKLKE